MDYTIRAAAKDDCKDMSRMIMESAIHGKNSNQVKITSEDLERDGFSQNPLFHCFVVQLPAGKQSKEGFCVVGMALYYDSYSTWRGHCLHLESLYVMQEFRGKGVGTALLSKVAEEASKSRCSRVELVVGDWNAPARRFYAVKGGSDITDGEGWHLIRFDGNKLEKLANEKQMF